jgi:hypothetical protein
MAYSELEKTSIINDLCDLICEGKSTREAIQVLKQDIPKITRKVLFDWINKDKSKSNQYARAMEYRADVVFDEIIQIADNSEGDTYTDEETGKTKVDHENINRSRLRVDARKWAISKMLPKKYGDKLDITSRTEDLSQEEQEARLKELLAKAKGLE